MIRTEFQTDFKVCCVVFKADKWSKEEMIKTDLKGSCVVFEAGHGRTDQNQPKESITELGETLVGKKEQK